MAREHGLGSVLGRAYGRLHEARPEPVEHGRRFEVPRSAAVVVDAGDERSVNGVGEGCRAYFFAAFARTSSR